MKISKHATEAAEWFCNQSWASASRNVSMTEACQRAIDNANAETLKLLREIQYVIESLPVGGIGKDGPTQSDLDAASESGQPVEGNADYHLGQQVWLLSEHAIQSIEQ